MLRSIIATHHPAGSARKRRVASFAAIHQVTVDELLGFFSVLGEISPQTSPTCCLLMVVPPWGSADPRLLARSTGK